MNAEHRIRELVNANLQEDRNVDGVRFIDGLFELASDLGEIRCTLAGERGLRFETLDRPAFEVEVNRAKAKLRMLCARLSVLCQESGSQCSPFGGEGCVSQKSGSPESGAVAVSQHVWNVRFKNTPSDQEFVIW